MSTGSIMGGITCFNGVGIRNDSDATITITGSTLSTYHVYNYSLSANQTCVRFLANEPTEPRNVTMAIRYSFNKTNFDFFYVADYSKMLKLRRPENTFFSD